MQGARTPPPRATKWVCFTACIMTPAAKRQNKDNPLLRHERSEVPCRGLEQLSTPRATKWVCFTACIMTPAAKRQNKDNPLLRHERSEVPCRGLEQLSIPRATKWVCFLLTQRGIKLGIQNNIKKKGGCLLLRHPPKHILSKYYLLLKEVA